MVLQNNGEFIIEFVSLFYVESLINSLYRQYGLKE